jgi:hypothetical protein
LTTAPDHLFRQPKLLADELNDQGGVLPTLLADELNDQGLSLLLLLLLLLLSSLSLLVLFVKHNRCP